MNKFLIFLLKKFISFDIYGHQIKLLYKGRNTKNTLLGAFFSFLTFALIILYFGQQLQDLFDNKNTVKALTYDIVTNKLFKKISNNSLDLAVSINRYDSYLKTVIDEQVFSLEVVNFVDNDDRVNFQQIQLNLEKCSSSRFFNEFEFQNILEVNKQNGYETYCLDFEKDFIVSQKSKASLVFYVTACNDTLLQQKYPSMECEKNKTIINQILKETQIEMIRTNMQFDKEDNTVYPIITLVKDEYFDLQSTEETVIVDYEIQENHVKGSSSRIHESLYEFKHDYFSTIGKQQYKTAITNDAFIQFTFYLSDEEKSFEIIPINFLQVLSNVGGLVQIVTVLVTFMIGPLQEFFFFQSLIKKIFLTQKHNEKEKIGDKQEKKKSYNLESAQPRNYLRMVLELRSRYRFYYNNREAFNDKFFFLCNLKKKNQRLRKQLFDHGEEKIRSSLDVVKIIKNMRELKMVSHLILLKFQRSLLPYLQKYLIESSFQRMQENIKKRQSVFKEEETDRTASRRQEEVMDSLTAIMLELFADSKQPQNIYNQILIDNIFIPDARKQNSVISEFKEKKMNFKIYDEFHLSENLNFKTDQNFFTPDESYQLVGDESDKQNLKVIQKGNLKQQDIDQEFYREWE
ncbi:UNKNOWN [Stylonychia lemnae]|uniref:Transmembrane protein n=1 Tax=Stylonychia lemnae TaxID=5949 RepID=A0A078A5V3_STYLE|nr:UNKNOWN [Stylonychia lemnae]|eukprot:CDW76139.1 UNKNOWN [Stylonychia lemnae]